MAIGLFLLRRYSPWAKVSLASYVLSLLPGLVLVLLIFISGFPNTLRYYWQWINITLFLTINSISYLRYSSDRIIFEIVWRSVLLGSACGSAIVALVLSQLMWKPLFLFLIVLSFFHFSEYFFIAITKPRGLSIESFILNHSPAYHSALAIAVIEYSLEAHFFPHIKEHSIISLIGFLICVGGEFLRKLAILTARTNFDHHIKSFKDTNHILVTHGIYSWSRHPAYVGWFCWSAGTQILCLNPVSFVFYVIASYRFFADRIEWEEKLLIDFFGQDYIEYQKKVPTRLPFIRGHIIDS